MTETYETIMARVPEVTWSMPPEQPDYQEMAQRQEYTEDRLRKAAEIVWMAVDSYQMMGGAIPLPPTESWLAEEVDALRRLLDTWGLRQESDGTPRAYWRARALLIMNLPRSEKASSSRRAARTPDVTDFDPKAEADALFGYIGTSVGQG
jgi:hypothetical protein